MWIILWLIVSVFILGIFVWSVRDLFQQKKVWKQYAQKMNLTYQQPRGLLVSPIVTGPMDSFTFSLFSEAEPTPDNRGQRYNSIIEFGLQQGFPISGVIGTAKMQTLIASLNLDKSVIIEDSEWDAAWTIRTTNAEIMHQYLTPARLGLLKKLFRMKILGALFIFNNTDAVLRIETADPLNNLERLEKIVKSVSSQVSILALQDEEKAALAAST